MNNKNSMELSHKHLVQIAYRWVLKNSSCGVAFKELNSLASNGEYPDVIGFGAWGHSVLIEVKISRSDFFADRKKEFRKRPEFGMGTQRFYCCPAGLLKKEDLPDGWGLIWVGEKGKARLVFSPYVGNIEERHGGFQKNILAEHGLMYSALRRLHIRGRIEEIYNPRPSADIQYPSQLEFSENNEATNKNDHGTIICPNTEI